MRARRAVLIGTLLCVAAGCASIFGIVDGTPWPDGGDSDGSSGSDASDGMMRVEAQPPPDVSVEANTATCDDFNRTLDMGGVFVSPAGTDNGTCSMAMPCRTLNAPILAMAVQRQKPIYLLQGDYPFPIDIAMGTSLVIEGGWMLDAGAWWPSCDFGLAQIHGNKAIATGQTAAYVAQGSSLTLRLVTVQNDPVTLGTAYGLFANQTTSITLEAVNLHSGAGVAGANGSPTNTMGPPNCVPGNAGQGANGGSGVPGNASYGLLGYDPGKGLDGVIGDPGGGGGEGGQYVGSCPSCEAGITGDAMMMMISCTNTGNVPTLGQPGQSGCGGGGGSGGTGATGAGASIALYVTGSGQLVLKSGTKLTSTTAGKGGNGGSGTNGAAGSPGANGGPFTSGYMCMGPTCGSVPCAVEGGAGGTAGGNGGTGGQGGGGGGGASVTLVRDKNVKTTVYDGSIFGFQFGGDGGSPNGQPGDQVPEITF